METPEIAAIGFAMAMTIYALLTALLLSRWKNSSISHLLAAAAGVTVLWAAALAFQGIGYADTPILTVVVEILRSVVWILVLLGMLAKVSAVRVMGLARSRYALVVSLIALAPFALYVVRASEPPSTIVTVAMGYLFAVLILSLVEQVYGNAPMHARPGLSYFCAAVAGLYLFDLLAYVLAISGSVVSDGYWASRGFVSVLFAAPLGVGIWRSFDLSFDMQFPRQIVFYTLGIAAIGVYVVLMVLGHYYVQNYAGNWGEVAAIVFVVAALTAVVLVGVSSSTRARLRVFLTKTFFQYKYDYRKEWLRFIATLSDSDPESMPSSAIRAVAQIVHSPGGVIWLEEQPEDGYLPAAALACDLPKMRPISREAELVRFLEERQWVLDAVEMEQHPARYDDLKLAPELGEPGTWWLLVPLLLGRNLKGFIVLLRPRVIHSLNFEDHDLLKTVGRHVATFVNQAESDRRSAESGQFGAYNRLTAFLMHDLNNLVAQQSLVVANAERHRSNPQFVDDAIETIAHSVARMRRLMTQLTTSREAPGLQETEIHSVVSGAISRAAPRKPEATLINRGTDAIVLADPERLTSAIEHLIRNAQDATGEDGRVEVRVERNESGVVVSVTDDGEGMTPEFVRSRLFRPFDSTKGSHSMGIGAYQAREYVRMIGGQLSVVTEPDVGTTFSIALDVAS
ncbi:MAG: XrtA/PEP-CTERM system histidine kinase PrsK [Pseudomonadota bacterium]